jgi:predicted AAA+ superfamily ATPase
MERDKMQCLIAWKNKATRKPLIVRGARQVGKTWLIKEFGRTQYEKMVYVNFENAPELARLFVPDLDTKRIINMLQIYSETQITPADTLIVFDEIQSVEGGLTSLKYFCEDAPEYHIVAAGSLLGMTLHQHVSFPVGKVDFLDIHPLSFNEFVRAIGKKMLADSLKEKDWNVLRGFHEQLLQYLRTYLYVGGMPEVVQRWLDTGDMQQVREVQRNIIDSYQSDFSKHAPYDQVPRIQMVWNSIPSQLAKENKKFIYGIVRNGSRAKDFEVAVLWLLDSGLLLKTNRISKPDMPLIAYQDTNSFKLFAVDVGLLGALSHLDAKTLLVGNEIFTEFKGALTEQYVMQELVARETDYIGYWTNDRSTSEVDFVIQDNGAIYPIEVKSSVNVKARSFKMFCEKYKPTNALRSSLLPYNEEEWMKNVPLYAIGC